MTTTDPVKQIQQAEKQVEKNLAKAGKQAKDLVLKTQAQGEKDLKQVEVSLSAEIKKVFDKKDKEVTQLEVKEKTKRVEELKKIDQLPANKTDKAVEHILKQI